MNSQPHTHSPGEGMATAGTPTHLAGIVDLSKVCIGNHMPSVNWRINLASIFRANCPSHFCQYVISELPFAKQGQVQTFNMKISFIHMHILVSLQLNKTNFHVEGFALELALKRRQNFPKLWKQNWNVILLFAHKQTKPTSRKQSFIDIFPLSVHKWVSRHCPEFWKSVDH